MTKANRLSPWLLVLMAVAAPGVRGETFHGSRWYPADRSFHADGAILGSVGEGRIAAYHGERTTFAERALDGDRAYRGAPRPVGIVDRPAVFRPVGSRPSDAPRFGEDPSLHGDRSFHADRTFHGGRLVKPATPRLPPLSDW